MFKVWFAKGYVNAEMIAVTDDEQSARDIADREYDNGMRDVTVEDQYGAVVYEACEEMLFDEF